MAGPGPPLLVNGFSVSSEPNVRETKMESGPSRRQLLSTSEKIRINATFRLDSAQAVQDFWDFWEGEANYGAAWFSMPMWTRGVQANHTVRISDPKIVPDGL